MKNFAVYLFQRYWVKAKNQESAVLKAQERFEKEGSLLQAKVLEFPDKIQYYVDELVNQWREGVLKEAKKLAKKRKHEMITVEDIRDATKKIDKLFGLKEE